jgi:hypothetical protein
MESEILLDLQLAAGIIAHWGANPPNAEQATQIMVHADNLLAKAETKGESLSWNNYYAFMFLIYGFNISPKGIQSAHDLLRDTILDKLIGNN